MSINCCFEARRTSTQNNRVQWDGKLSSEPCLDLIIFYSFKGRCIKISMISHKLLFHIWIMFNFDQKVADFLVGVFRTPQKDPGMDPVKVRLRPRIPSSLLSTSSKWQSSRRSWSKVSNLIIKISEGLLMWCLKLDIWLADEHRIKWITLVIIHVTYRTLRTLSVKSLIFSIAACQCII